MKKFKIIQILLEEHISLIRVVIPYIISAFMSIFKSYTDLIKSSIVPVSTGQYHSISTHCFVQMKKNEKINKPR